MAVNITNNMAHVAQLMSNVTKSDPVQSLSNYICWVVVDSILFIIIVSGNVLTILAIRLTRRLKMILSNYFILNLAISDLMVGLTLPYRLTFYLSNYMNTNKVTCLLRFILICFTCCASIYNVTAIAVDRYVAVVHPFKYTKLMTKKVVFLIIITGWIYSFTVSIVPFYWNCFNINKKCEIEEVLPRYYTISILIPTFVTVCFITFLMYWKIAREAVSSAKRLKVQHMRIGASDRKSIQVVLITLCCFSICWMPFFIIACTRIFNWKRSFTPIWYEALFSLTMANSGMNPIIYAWKNSKFRRAFQRLLHCQMPDRYDYNHSLKKYLRKQNELLRNENQFENNNTIKRNTAIGTICNCYTVVNETSLRSNTI